MRESTIWKIGICLVAGLALPLCAQETAPRIPPSTPDQLAQLDRLPGIGPLKFGADRGSFDPTQLRSLDNPNNPPGSTTNFAYTPTTPFTWGTLTPTRIELEFFYNQLVSIRLFYNDTNGALIPVYRAVLEKYGNTAERGTIQFNDSGYGALQWISPGIVLRVSLPQTIPPQSSDNFLNEKSQGAVELFDAKLHDKLTHQKLDALRDQLLKSQDLDKIKGDL